MWNDQLQSFVSACRACQDQIRHNTCRFKHKFNDWPRKIQVRPAFTRTGWRGWMNKQICLATTKVSEDWLVPRIPRIDTVLITRYYDTVGI